MTRKRLTSLVEIVAALALAGATVLAADRFAHMPGLAIVAAFIIVPITVQAAQDIRAGII